MFIDIHTHHLKEIKDEIFIYSGSDHFNSLPEHAYLSLGVHPWFIDSEYQMHLTEIEVHLENGRLIAVGEAGIDKLKGPSINLQQEIFMAQAALAEKYHKPLIVHCVRAYQELIELQKKMNPTETWIIHGFRGNLKTAQLLIQHGFCLSFGTSLLHDEKLSVILKNIPLGKIFFETDDHNEPVSKMYFKASQILNSDVGLLEKQIADNFEKIFKSSLR